jgi:hypothetical protein
MQEHYLITLNRPQGVSISEMNAYIKDAVASWANGGDPESPLFNFRKHMLSVKRVSAKASGGAHG